MEIHTNQLTIVGDINLVLPYLLNEGEVNFNQINNSPDLYERWYGQGSNAMHTNFVAPNRIAFDTLGGAPSQWFALLCYLIIGQLNLNVELILTSTPVNTPVGGIEYRHDEAGEVYSTYLTH